MASIDKRSPGFGSAAASPATRTVMRMRSGVASGKRSGAATSIKTSFTAPGAGVACRTVPSNVSGPNLCVKTGARTVSVLSVAAVKPSDAAIKPSMSARTASFLLSRRRISSDPAAPSPHLSGGSIGSAKYAAIPLANATGNHKAHWPRSARSMFWMRMAALMRGFSGFFDRLVVIPAKAGIHDWDGPPPSRG